MSLAIVAIGISAQKTENIWKGGICLTSNDGLEPGGNDPKKDSHEYVDLGLPSGTLWATMNIGASKPEEYGDYFAWGETIGYNSGKTNFNWSTYKWCNGSEYTMIKYCTDSSYGNIVDDKTVLEPEDDAATVNLGSNWRIPTIGEFEEIIDSSYTTVEWTTMFGVNGRKISSKKNGNSIFLPAAGIRTDTNLYGAGSYVGYLSSSLDSSRSSGAQILYFNSSYIFVDGNFRFGGFGVRPVRRSASE